MPLHEEQLLLRQGQRLRPQRSLHPQRHLRALGVGRFSGSGIDVMTMTTIQLKLTVTGPADPETLEKLFGTSATRSWRANDGIGGSKLVRKSDGWQLASDECSSLDLEALVADFFAKIPLLREIALRHPGPATESGPGADPRARPFPSIWADGLPIGPDLPSPLEIEFWRASSRSARTAPRATGVAYT